MTTADSIRFIDVRKTAVGRGLFALSSFSAETFLGEVMGEVRPNDHYSDYCIDMAGKALLEPDRPFRFLNHSCEPNCELIQWKVQRVNGLRLPRLWLKTLRDIAVGEELTIDYAWSADQAIECMCGSAKCRGFVVAATERVIHRARRMGIDRQRNARLKKKSECRK
jgi:SET domain-containing protein